jgi:hypothetical protein
LTRKPGVPATGHRQLVDRAAERGEATLGVFGHRVVPDDFHQRHQRTGLK